MNTTTKTFNLKHIKATMEVEHVVEDVYLVNVQIEELNSIVLWEKFKRFNCPKEAEKFIHYSDKKVELLKLFDEYCTDMSQDHWYSANHGIPEDSLNDLVDSLLSKYDVKEKIYE